jgi:hypothetical protein
MTPKAVDKAEQAGNSASLEVLARVGLIAFGLVHLLVGWLALLIAWGAAAGSADSSGALTTLADQPFGKIMLWLVAVGLTALALLQASEAIWGYRRHGGARRVRMQVTSGAKAMIYAALGVSAASVALGSGSSSSQSQEQATTGVLAWPGGQIIVVAAGLIIISVGVASVIKGVRRSFDEEIDTASMPSTVRKGVGGLGQVGYIASRSDAYGPAENDQSDQPTVASAPGAMSTCTWVPASSASTSPSSWSGIGLSVVKP